MIWKAVASLNRGAIDPPERCGAALDHMLNLTLEQEERVQQAIWERDRPMSIEEMWFLQGREAGYTRSRRIA